MDEQMKYLMYFKRKAFRPKKDTSRIRSLYYYILTSKFVSGCFTGIAT